MTAPDTAAKTAYDKLAAQYEALVRDVTTSRCTPAASERARTNLAYARSLFRIAALQAPREFEEREEFWDSLDAIGAYLGEARSEIT